MWLYKRKKYIFSFFCLWLSFTKVDAQFSLDGLDLSGDVLAWHDELAGLENSGVVVGEYFQVNRLTRGDHQFYKSDHWEAGNLHYRGQLYEDISLMYDIEGDLLLLRHPTKIIYYTQAIKPIQDQVEWFQIYGSSFRYYKEQILFFNPGFYEEMYIGDELSLISKRRKYIKVERIITYENDPVFIMHYGDEFIRLKTKGSMIRQFKVYKKEINQFVRQNNLQIQPEFEGDIIRLVAYCDQLLGDKRGNQ